MKTKTKTKILYLSPSNRMLGARISLLNMLKYLDKEKYEPVVVSPDNEDGFLQSLDEIGVRYYRLCLWSWRKGKYWLRIPFTIWKLKKIMRKENIDLVHSNEFWCTPYAVIAGKYFLKIPVVTHIRLFITIKKAKQYLLKWADVIVSVSQATGNLLQDWKYYDKVRTVYNGLDPVELFGYEEKRRIFRKEFQLDDKDIAIGEIAQLDTRKNQHRVIEIIPSIVQQYPRARFFFIGDSPKVEYEMKIKRRCRELNIEKNCFFIGRRQDIPSVCAGLDIKILPSTMEGFGRALIEAMYMKTPVVGSNVGGIPEVIEHDNCGYVFPLERFDLLKEYLLRLIGDRELREKMGENGRLKVENEFLASKCARRMEEIYELLLEKSKNNISGRKK